MIELAGVVASKIFKSLNNIEMTDPKSGEEIYAYIQKKSFQVSMVIICVYWALLLISGIALTMLMLSFGFEMHIVNMMVVSTLITAVLFLTYDIFRMTRAKGFQFLVSQITEIKKGDK